MFAGIRDYLGVFLGFSTEENGLETIHRNERYSLIPEAIILSVVVQIFIPWIPIWVHENYAWKGIGITTFWLALLSYAVLLNKAVSKYQKEIRSLTTLVESMKVNSSTIE